MDHELWQMLNENRSGIQELGNGMNLIIGYLEFTQPAKWKQYIDKIKKESQQQK